MIKFRTYASKKIVDTPLLSLSPTVLKLMHGELVCIGFCLSICLSLWGLHCAPPQGNRATVWKVEKSSYLTEDYSVCTRRRDFIPFDYCHGSWVWEYSCLRGHSLFTAGAGSVRPGSDPVHWNFAPPSINTLIYTISHDVTCYIIHHDKINPEKVYNERSLRLFPSGTGIEYSTMPNTSQCIIERHTGLTIYLFFQQPIIN